LRHAYSTSEPKLSRKGLRVTGQQRKAELIENILQLGDKAFRELFPILPKGWLQLDLTMPQLKVVLLLFLSGPSRMGDIASALGVSLATATGVVDRLVEREVVLRDSDPADRRVVLCRLSDKGQKLMSSLWQLARDRARELLNAIDRPQLLLITQALEALLQAGEATKDDVRHD
jgi:DNA-binding MarR family transcriptional regulator